MDQWVFWQNAQAKHPKKAATPARRTGGMDLLAMGADGPAVLQRMKGQGG